MNKTPVVNPVTQSCSRQGALFYAAFRSVLNGYLAQQITDAVPLLVKQAAAESGMVGNLLVGIMNHIGRDRQFRKK